MKHTIVLLWGGGGEEHRVSQVSANHLKQAVEQNLRDDEQLITIELKDASHWVCGKDEVIATSNGELIIGGTSSRRLKPSVVLPCIHGHPGETGDLQSLFEMSNIPFLGPGSEASKLCFNKVSTKLWLERFGIATAPFEIVHRKNSADQSCKKRLFSFFNNNGQDVFVKASSQGSSVGCYRVRDEQELMTCISKAHQYSDYAIVEQTIQARELELSVFEYQGEIKASRPGEIVCPDSFYSYDEKYSEDSKSKTIVPAVGPSREQEDQFRSLALRAFNILNLKDLSRIDFFWNEEGIFINEINTMPGLTPISLFPKMVEDSGISFGDFIRDRLDFMLSKSN